MSQGPTPNHNQGGDETGVVGGDSERANRDLSNMLIKGVFMGGASDKRIRMILFVSVTVGLFMMSPIWSAEIVGEKAKSKIKIFDGKPKTIMVHGYSTSFQWPRRLQRKLDMYFQGKRVLEVVPVVKSGTPIARWMNIETGKPLQSWLQLMRPKMKAVKDETVIVLAQQSLEWVYGEREDGIRNAEDAERIKAGADVIGKYVNLLKEEGADLVFISTHIYKKSTEPVTENERYALDEFLKQKPDSVVRGPDLWSQTKERYPRIFASDGVNPNALGAELMAQAWFETLLKHDSLEIPRHEDARQGAELNIAGVSLRTDTRVLRDIEYVTGGHERQKLDLYLPNRTEAAGVEASPLPLIIWVHGGAWLAGSKDNCPARRMLSRGYAVASINYRLSQHAVFPAQIQDCKAAIRWLRANASKYGFDPDRFGVWGSSAGGHLVALLGASGDVKDFDVGSNLNVSSRVQAVCDFFGPTDFTKMSSFWTTMDHDSADSPESKLLGGPIQENKDKCKAANPITYISKDDPPFLICHGDKDPLVPHNQSEMLYDALKKADVDVKFHTVRGGGHGFRDAEVDRLVEEFFDKHLKK